MVLLCRAAMNVEEQIKQLCQKMIATKSDEEAIELARELRPLLDRRVMELRTTPDGAPGSRAEVLNRRDALSNKPFA
jgi:signal transduction histidine kinase